MSHGMSSSPRMEFKRVTHLSILNFFCFTSVLKRLNSVGPISFPIKWGIKPSLAENRHSNRYLAGMQVRQPHCLYNTGQPAHAAELVLGRLLHPVLLTADQYTIFLIQILNLLHKLTGKKGYKKTRQQAVRKKTYHTPVPV